MMNHPTFNHTRTQALNLLTALGNAELSEAERYEVLDDENGAPDDIAEFHALRVKGRWHIDILYRDGRSIVYAADDTREQQTTNA